MLLFLRDHKPGPPAEQPAELPTSGTVVRETAWRRFRHWLRGLLQTRWRELTPAEADLAAEVNELSRKLWDAREATRKAELELEQARSENKIMAKEVAMWAEVHERDRARVEADTAAYAHFTGILTPRHQQPG